MNPSPPYTRLAIPPALSEAMIAHARVELPNECCGLLAGRVVDGTATVEMRFPIRNDAASPTAYFTNAEDLLNASKAIRAAHLVELAIYHSHPRSAPIPSRTDLVNNTWGETAAHIIIGNLHGEPEVRAWWLREREYEPVVLV